MHRRTKSEPGAAAKLSTIEQVSLPIPGALRRRLAASKPARNLYYRHFLARKINSDDVLIVHYPKSGSHWLRFMLYALVSDKQGDFDSVYDAIPPLQLADNAPSSMPGGGRMFHTHFPLLPSACRVIYLIRDPRDVAVSFRRMLSGGHSSNVSQDGYLDRFLESGVDVSGAWKNHVELALAEEEKANNTRFLMVRYERLQADTEGELHRVAKFLGLSADTARVRFAVDSSSRSAMSQSEASSSLTGGSDSYAFVGSAGRSDHKQNLSNEELQLVTERLSATLRRAGY